MAIGPSSVKTALFARFMQGLLQVIDQSMYPRNVVWVSSTGTGTLLAAGASSDAAGYGNSPEAPYATVLYACTHVSAGDTILVLPGHSENVGVACSTTADTRIIGLGRGPTRPRLTANAGISSFFTAGNGIVFDNLQFATSAAGVTQVLNITGNGVVVRNCQFKLADATNQITAGVNCTGTDPVIEDNTFYGSNNAGTTAAIILQGADRAIVRRNRILGAFSSGVGGIQGVTTDSVAIFIHDNLIDNLTASCTKCMVFTTATTGVLAGNRLQILSGTAPITAAAMASGSNYYANTIGPGAGTLI